VLSEQLRNTVVLAYAQAGFEVEPAVRYLRMAGRVRHWPEKDDADLAVLVEDAFMAVDADEVWALADAEDPRDPVALRDATKYVEEWRLCKVWALGQNLAKGVAPSSEDMLGQLAADRAAAGREDALDVGSIAEARSRMFLTRLRRRWGGRFGSIRECEELSLDEALPKATRAYPWRVHVAPVAKDACLCL